LETRAASGRRPSTFTHYSKKLAYVLPAVGTVRLDKLMRQDVDRVLVALRARGLSARTVSHVRAVLRNALQSAVRDGKLPRNPAADAEPRALGARADTMHVLDPAEAGQLVAAARDDRLGSMAVLALTTGMRMGEVLGLRWCDVDLAACVLRITYALQRIDGRQTLVQPKTERSRRAIPLPSVAVEALERRHAQWHLDQLAAGARGRAP
jgi:integrase